MELGAHAGISLDPPEQLLELTLAVIRLGKRGELSTLPDYTESGDERDRD